MPKISQKGFALVPLLLVLVVVIIIALVLISQGLVRNPLSQKSETSREISSQQSSVSLQTQYQNPFDKNAQYVNPFSEYKNPFDQLK